MEAFTVLGIVLVIVCWACYKRKIIKAVYGIASVEIILQLCNLLARNVGDNVISRFLLSFPNSVVTVAGEHTSGIVYDVIVWAFIGLMMIFVYETTKTFFKK